jgi:hypothetical protein
MCGDDFVDFCSFSSPSGWPTTTTATSTGYTMTEPSTIDTLTKHDNGPDFKDQLRNAVVPVAEPQQQQQERPTFATEARIPLVDASPVSYSLIDNERIELEVRNRRLEEIILQQHQQQQQQLTTPTPTPALSTKKVWIRLGMLVTVVVVSLAAMIAGIYCGTAAGNCRRGGVGGNGSVSSPIAALAASPPSLPPLSAPPSRPPSTLSPVTTAADTSTWICNIGDSNVGEVTIDWGHTKGDATWACNEWRAACENSSCAAAPAESKWNCFIDMKKVGNVTINSGHMVGDAVLACNAWKIGGCAGQCSAGSSWNCKRGNETVADPVEIWWSNNDQGAATWACNEWRKPQCNNSCQAENWIWTYTYSNNPNTTASSAPTAAPSPASRHSPL